MITVELKKSKRLKKDKKSLFISFNYNLDRVKLVKSLPLRAYNPDNRSWEVPVNNLAEVTRLFSNEEIKLVYNTNQLEQVKEDMEPLHKNVVPMELEPVDFDFKTLPFDHQVEGFRYGMKNNKFLLGDEQGLGKTKQAIDIAVSKKKQFKHVLIVCGVNSLKHNWVNEIRTHSNEKSQILGSYYNKKGKLVDGTMKDRLADLEDLEEFEDTFFLITNIESLRLPKGRSKPKNLSEQQHTQLAIMTKLEKLTKSGTIGMVIIDEIHKAKNSQSQQGKAIHKLNSKYKMALTGTPLMNQPLDLYNVLHWLDVDKHSFFQFRNRYCNMGGFGGYEVVGYKNLEELRAKLDANMLRRKKAEVLNLPPKVRQTEYVEMTAKQALLYKEVKNNIVANLDNIALSPNPLAQLVRLRQVTGAPSAISDTITESAKVDRLKEIAEELVESGQKAIVFSNWTSVTDILEVELKQYSPAVVTGATKDRQGEVDRFQNDPNCKMIIGTIGAMGTGLTLTAGTTVIFMDKPWNMANTEQAEDRAHRIGTTGTVSVITLVCKDTIDERIESIILDKADMAEALVDGKFDKMSKVQLLQTLLS